MTEAQLPEEKLDFNIQAVQSEQRSHRPTSSLQRELLVGGHASRQPQLIDPVRPAVRTTALRVEGRLAGYQPHSIRNKRPAQVQT